MAVADGNCKQQYRARSVLHDAPPMERPAQQGYFPSKTVVVGSIECWRYSIDEQEYVLAPIRGPNAVNSLPIDVIKFL